MTSIMPKQSKFLMPPFSSLAFRTPLIGSSRHMFDTTLLRGSTKVNVSGKAMHTRPHTSCQCAGKSIGHTADIMQEFNLA